MLRPTTIVQSAFSFGASFLWRTKLSKGKIEKQVVDDLYCTGDVEREIDEPRTGEEKARQQRTNRRTCSARYSCESSGSRSLSSFHHGHGIGLPRRYVHLTDAGT